MKVQTIKQMKNPLERIHDESSLSEWSVSKHPEASFVSQAVYTVWAPNGEDFAHTFTAKNAELIRQAMAKLFPVE